MKPAVVKLTEAQMTRAIGEFVYNNRAAFAVADLPAEFTVSTAFRVRAGAVIETLAVVGPPCAEGYRDELEEALKAMKDA